MAEHKESLPQTLQSHTLEAPNGLQGGEPGFTEQEAVSHNAPRLTLGQHRAARITSEGPLASQHRADHSPPRSVRMKRRRKGVSVPLGHRDHVPEGRTGGRPTSFGWGAPSLGTLERAVLLTPALP